MSKWFRQQLSNKLTHNLIFFAKECFKTFDQANVFLVSSISFDYRTLSNSVDDLKGQCRIQDILGFWIPRRVGLRIPATGFRIFVSGTWILNSNRQWGSGFLDLYSGFHSPGFQISQANISQILKYGIPLYGARVYHAISYLFKKQKLGFASVLLFTTLFKH